MTAEQCERFLSKLSIGSDDECWEYVRTKRKSPYAWFSYKGVRGQAHRLAWEWQNGPIPAGLYVCHNCPGGDNPRCCNPAHLFLGPAVVNSRDMVNKGRQNKGEGVHLAKLTEAAVRDIRANCGAQRGMSLVFADRYGVSPQTIRLIVRGKIWKHLEGRGNESEKGVISPSKLSDAQVREIRQRHDGSWGIGQRLAREYGISDSAVSAIVLRQTWKHLKE